MPDDQHPGFEYWEVNDPAHAYPVGPVSLELSGSTHISGNADVTFPQALPKDRTVAERSIGVAGEGKLWFGLECSTDAQGKVTCEAVLRARHLAWFPSHDETAPGSRLEVRLTQAELNGTGHKQAAAAHGPLHCDVFTVWWGGTAAKANLHLVLWHFEMSLDSLRQAQEEAKHKAKQGIGSDPGLADPPATPTPTPPPPPPPPPLHRLHRLHRSTRGPAGRQAGEAVRAAGEARRVLQAAGVGLFG
jgi:hypothetical protein